MKKLKPSTQYKKDVKRILNNPRKLKAPVTQIDAESSHKEDSSRMGLFDQLAGSISLKDIDMSDERTNNLLNK